MTITKELDLVNFTFWSGAKQHNFTYNELQQLEDILEDVFCDKTASETDINDLFWFEDETLCGWLGLDYDEYLNR
jgi:hypothetical protein